MTASTHRGARPTTACFIIGFGLSGFFDGILLHQVLQWHHLLSLVEGASIQRIETQILADGLFHVLMYLVTAAGLWLLWRGRRSGGQPEAGRRLWGAAALGFGVWNFVDVGLFHWVLGIHRIRVDVNDPLAYDVGWLVLFGVLPALIGWRALRGGSDHGGGGRRAAIALSLLALVLAPVAAMPPRGSSSALVVFAPGTATADRFDAVLAADARLLWTRPDGRMMAVALQDGSASRLYAGGALIVTRSAALAGCMAALQT